MEYAPVWQVHNAKDYNTFEEEHDDHLALGVSLYIPLDPNHKNEGEFRIAILGGDDEEVCVPAINVYHVLPAAVADTMLHFAFSSVKTLLPGNSTACPWQDANTLIRNGAVQTRIKNII
jgi:hypothetical protein